MVLSFEHPGTVTLDSRGLQSLVATAGGRAVQVQLGAVDPVLGAPLRLELPTDQVTLSYETAPDASALQWLDPVQTQGGRHPFLFSQCQAIHARSIIPLQDSPRHRVPWFAQVRVPKALRVVMAAEPVSRVEAGDWATECFDMAQPVPPYLFAFAVGDLTSRELSARSRVWAEPALVEAAAHEFADVEAMMTCAEGLFGPYDWQRFDVVVMPPSFPYGGMENPRLTFVTPALVVGDRSLVDVIAHELAHSWTGNLVTNANAEHFWLNEGFTVYAERRIVEALAGPEAMALSAALGRRELEAAVTRFAAHPELTRLRTHLQGVDPDEAFSVVPYEKGYLLLVLLERLVGREAFDVALKSWLRTYRFGAVTTDDFVGFFDRALPGALAKVGASAWLDGTGVPDNAPAFESARLASLEQASAPPVAGATPWSPTEWVLWLGRQPRPSPVARLTQLDAQFGLSSSKNPEIAVAWAQLAVASGLQGAEALVERLLGSFGRMKYLRPLYASLMASPATRATAHRVFEANRAKYHPIAQGVVARLLAQA